MVESWPDGCHGYVGAAGIVSDLPGSGLGRLRQQHGGTDSDRHGAERKCVVERVSGVGSSRRCSPFLATGEVSGTLASDWAGDSDLTLKSSQRNVGGAIVGDPDPSTTFSAGSKTGGAAQFGPQSFSAEAWFKTTTRSGGKIIGFGSVNTNNSSSSDRHVYMSNSGQLSFGANANGFRTVTSPTSYNDGKWHHVVGVLGSTGMRLYVDGGQVAERVGHRSG